ncbi:ankyrin repeat-containing domain protein [Annulohypoxylon nitens]|nr:ankyrin repeat-containing domain protein [Annulohypoxylon nitens]
METDTGRGNLLKRAPRGHLEPLKIKDKLKHDNWSSRDNKILSDPVGAAMYHASKDTYTYLVSQGAAIPCKMAHYAATELRDFGLILFLIESYTQILNECDDDGKTLLQAVLPSRYEVSKAVKLLRGQVASILLDKGIKIVGGEAVQAALLGNWDLVNRILDLDRDGVSQKHRRLTMLHAAFAGCNFTTIQNVLNMDPKAYNPNTLCIATYFACNAKTNTNKDRITSLLNRLLSNRIPRQEAANEETLAIGVASYYEDIPIMELILKSISPSHLVGFPWLLIPFESSFLYPDLNFCLVYPLEFVESDGPRIMWTEISPLAFALKSPRARGLLLRCGLKADLLVLKMAIDIQDVSVARQFIELGQWAFNKGLLLRAVESGNYDMVEFLVEEGEDVNDLNKYDKSPLQAAIEAGDLKIINLLLDKDPAVNPPPDIYHDTALQLACEKGYLRVVMRLI